MLFAAGCSADVSRFDLGSQAGSEASPSAGYAPSDSGRGGSQGGYGSSSAYAPPSSYNDNNVSRSELDTPPRQPMTTSAINPSQDYSQQRGQGSSQGSNSWSNSGSNTAQNGSYGYPSQTPGRVPPIAQREPAASSAPTRVASLPEKGEMIEVQQGDTLYGLSRRHQVSVSEMMSLNELSGPNLKPGQKLYLPAGASSAQASPPSARKIANSEPVSPSPAADAPSDWSGSYTMKQGDSLYNVARDHKIKLTDLQRYNGISDARKVKPGTVLKMPGSDGGGSEVKSAKAEPSRTGPVQPQSMAETASPPPTTSSVAPSVLNAESPPADNRVAKLETPNTANDASPGQGSGLGEGSVAGSKLRWPVAGKVVSAFGPRADGTHNDGVNVAVPLGTDVHAAESGVVAYAGDELKGYGNLVLLRHDNGWVTAYAHADEILVKRGDRIKRGQIIAKAGRTGQVDQPQVHFELRQGQKPVDPTPFMERM